MNLPFFYIPSFNSSEKELELNEESSRHVIQVLRMRAGEQLHLTDGAGNLILAEILSEHKKHCVVKVRANSFKERPGRVVTVCVSLLKNSARFEWFLEKATELGISRVIPLLCTRTEKQKFRFDRMQQICISAMLQSQQCWLPGLSAPETFREVVFNAAPGERRYIAHCIDGYKQQLAATDHCRILIGPEGDFTQEEVQLATDNEYLPVTLGETRLRSETAAVVAASLLQLA